MSKKSKEILVDKFIQVFSSGGWSVVGRVIGTEDDRIIIEDENEVLSLIFRDKISILSVLSHKNYIQELKRKLRKEDVERAGYNYNSENNEEESGFNLPKSRPVNSSKEAIIKTEENMVGTDNHYGSIIPEDILINSEVKNPEEDLSCSFSTKHNTRIEFKLEDDT